MAETVNFDGKATGAEPRGWILTMTGTGHPKWTVEKDDTAPSKSNVLKQSGTATYPLALKEGTNIKDGFVEVSRKAGRSDVWSACGWRRAKAGQRLFIIPALQLVIAMTAGNYGKEDQWIPPTQVLREVILESIR